MKKTKEFIVAMLIRALWTMAETALGMITVGATITEVAWGHVASVAAVAGVYSIIKSLAVGLPEILPPEEKGKKEN